jgi:thiol-disulfide isomerase/thioredoxin
MKLKWMTIILIGIFGCTDNEKTSEINQKTINLVEGDWLMTFQLTAEETLPVRFLLTKKDSLYTIEFANASEKIKIENIAIENNRLKFDDPVFNSWYEFEIISSSKMKGFWFKDNQEYKISFEAEHGEQNRFKKPKNLVANEQIDVTGKWKVDFSPKNQENYYPAIGLFEQQGEYLSGTFLTETGDYRFLEGNVYENEFFLSCFDGSHAFLFKATLENDSLIGSFWSGSHWEEPWVAIRDDKFELTNPDSLTFLNDGYDKIEFAFKNTNDELVSLTDEKFKGKVVIVNIMGPWCANCKDETAFLTDLYSKKKKDGLEIIALSFDRTDDVDVAKKNIEKLKNHFNTEYEFLLAGKASKIEAGKALPMLNHIMSYPTTIFIDKKGNVRKIRTGFYGPGTGNYYKRYAESVTNFVDKLLVE